VREGVVGMRNAVECSMGTELSIEGGTYKSSLEGEQVIVTQSAEKVVEEQNDKRDTKHKDLLRGVSNDSGANSGG